MLEATLFFIVILMGLFVSVFKKNDILLSENQSLKLEIEDLKQQNNRLSEEIELLELSRNEMLKINFKNLSNSK